MHPKKMLRLARELANIELPSWEHRLAALRESGVPTNDVDLRERLAKQDDALTGLKEDAGDKWNGLQAAKQAVVDFKGDDDAEVIKALDDAGKAYGSVADKIAAAEGVKQTLVDAMIASGQAPEGARHSGSEREAHERSRAEARQTAGQRIIAGELYRALQQDPAAKPGSKGAIGARPLGEAWDREETKAALLTGASDTSGGAFVQADRVGYFPMPLRPLTILDLITIGDTDSDLVEFVRQTSFSNAAAETAEATAATGTSGVKPESAMDFEIVQTGVKTVAHWVPATKRALSDAGQLRTIIDGLLRYGLDRRLEQQIVAGTGAGENLRGILETTGTNAVPAGAQSHADKTHFGITAIRLDDLEPTGIAMHPTDWETVRLSRDNEGGAGTGDYLFGPPSAMGANTLWGKPVAVTASVPQGTAIVGDFRAYVLWMREGTQVLASDSHDNFFIRNLIAILAELRAAAGVPLPQAFAEVNLAAS